MKNIDDDFEFPDEIEAKNEAKKEKAVVEDDKFEVEIEDDTPTGDRNRKPMKEPVEDPTEEELATYDEKVQARIKKFTRGYHDERRAKEEAVRERTAAETFAKQVFEENKRLQQQLANGSKAYIETSKGAAETDLQVAKKKYKEAYESGDADALTEANAEITRAALRLERAAGMQPIEVEEKEYQPAVAPKPIEHPRTQRWVEANSDWWGKDEEMTAAAMGLDRRLQREYGADFIGSKEYFDVIDKTMRKRFPEQFETAQSDEPDEDSTPRRATKPSTVVAPATRSTPPNRIKLKASEAAIARRLGVPLELYAKQVAQLKRGE
jgi:hypothetical protein